MPEDELDDVDEDDELEVEVEVLEELVEEVEDELVLVDEEELELEDTPKTISSSQLYPDSEQTMKKSPKTTKCGTGVAGGSWFALFFFSIHNELHSC